MKYEDQRKETPFAVRDNMLDIRTHLTELAYRSFGKKPRKMPNQPGNWNEWSEESRKRWLETQKNKLLFAEKCDKRFIKNESKWFNKTLRKMVCLIDRANTLNPQTEHECDIQRDMQNEVIGLCNNLKRELNYIADTIPSNKNFAVKIIDDINREIALVSGWRKSCNVNRQVAIQKDINRKLKAQGNL